MLIKKLSSFKYLALLSIFLFIATTVIIEPANAAKKKQYTSSLASSRPATGRHVFVYNSSKLKWAVYNPSGKLIRSGHGVAGKAYCPDVKRGCRTPHGTFRIYHKVGPHFRSSRYPLPHGGALMPYGMFFHKGYAIHGSNDVPNRHASHGCIRVIPSQAQWLNRTLPIGTTVIVTA